ncbi:MAG: radical SAM protein [Pirellulaceae bacterium]
MNPLAADTPQVSISHLDQLWFQVSGTLCNLTCHHCFISCSPHNDSFGHLTLEQVRARLREAVALGVNEYYFTGGEPFLNRDLVPMLELALRQGPATVLTNATVLKPEWLTRLKAAHDQSEYSLEFRVSIDGFSAETNDPIRGEGTFVRAMRGVTQLVEFGFLPIITAARTWPEQEDAMVLARFREVLRAAGYARPRIKLLPTIKLGAEVKRTEGYRDSQRVTAEMMEGFDTRQLICDHARLVTDRGVQVCPILLEAEDAVLSETTMAESLKPYALRHGACYTCYQYGSICANPSGGSLGSGDRA